MRNEMEIAAYIFEKTRKGPIFKASNQSKGSFQLMKFSRFYLKYTCTKI